MNQILDLLLKIVDSLIALPAPVAVSMVFGMLLICGLGLPLPEDITLLAAGYYAHHRGGLWIMIIVGFVGVILGDSVIYFLGAKYGRPLTRKWIFHKLLPDERLDKVRQAFHRRGNKLIFFGRFLPGLRAPIYFSAGILHLPYRVLFFYDGLAALLSVPAIICAAYYFAEDMEKVLKTVRGFEHGILFLFGLVVVGTALRWYITHRKLTRT